MSFIQFRTMPCGGGASNYPQPFDITITSGKATIAPGTVNGVFPTNWAASQTVSPTQTVYGYIFANTNGANVTDATVVFNTNYDPSQIPVNNALPSTFQYAFGIIISGTPYRTMGGGSIVAWGETQYIKGKTTPLAPGELPYETFNVWICKAEGDPRLMRNN